eukprot:403342407
MKATLETASLQGGGRDLGFLDSKSQNSDLKSSTIFHPIKVVVENDQKEQKSPNAKKIRISKVFIENDSNSPQQMTAAGVYSPMNRLTQQQQQINQNQQYSTSYIYNNSQINNNQLGVKRAPKISMKRLSIFGGLADNRSSSAHQDNFTSTQMQKLTALLGGATSTDASTQNQNVLSSNFLSPNFQDTASKPSPFSLGTSSKKPPNIPSLKSKIQQAALQVPSQRSNKVHPLPLNPQRLNKKQVSSNLSSFNREHKKQQQSTSGNRQRQSIQVIDSEQRNIPRIPLARAQTFLSQVTQSALTLDDFLDPKDQQHLINFRVEEDKQVNSGYPSSKVPYMFLNLQQTQVHQVSMHRDHQRKRIIFSNMQELDDSIGENNFMKRLQYRNKMNFQQWQAEMAEQTSQHRLRVMSYQQQQQQLQNNFGSNENVIQFVSVQDQFSKQRQHEEELIQELTQEENEEIETAQVNKQHNNRYQQQTILQGYHKQSQGNSLIQ